MPFCNTNKTASGNDGKLKIWNVKYYEYILEYHFNIDNNNITYWYGVDTYI